MDRVVHARGDQQEPRRIRRFLQRRLDSCPGIGLLALGDVQPDQRGQRGGIVFLRGRSEGDPRTTPVVGQEIQTSKGELDRRIGGSVVDESIQLGLGGRKILALEHRVGEQETRVTTPGLRLTAASRAWPRSANRPFQKRPRERRLGIGVAGIVLERLLIGADRVVGLAE